jgi:archaeosine-15-forming tRNA-guanine transglycosylase
MEDWESYRKRLRTARLRSEGVVREIMTHKGKLMISFPQHDGIFTLPVDRPDLLARITESHDKQEKIAFTFDGELTIVSID